MKINKEKAIQSLNDGFCIVFGEKHRKFLTEIGDKVVELGYKNGAEWCENLLFDKISSVRLEFLLKEKGHISQEEIDKLTKDLKIFFNDDDIEKLCDNEAEYNEYAGHYMSGIGEYETKILDTIKAEDATLQQATPFDYFRQFKLSDEPQFDSVTLYSEGGLGLDQYNIREMKYYSEKNELFYPIEAIVRKYHYLGMLLYQEELLIRWIDKILVNMTPELDYTVKGILRNVIYTLSRDSVSDSIILRIQKVCEVVDGFMTNKQVHDKLCKRNHKDLD